MSSLRREIGRKREKKREGSSTTAMRTMSER